MPRLTTLTTLALAGSLLAGALFHVPPAAADESPHEKIERLLPRLDSPDPTVRDQAERDIFGLGDAGRREMERLSRDADPRRAQTALRLLQSNRWAVTPKAEEEPGAGPRKPAERLRPGERRLEPLEESLRDLDETLDERMEEVRRELRELLRSQRRHFELPRFPELPELPDAFEMPRLRLDFGQPGVASKGSVARDGDRIEWSIEADGRVKVTTRDGEDAEERTFEAESLDALRKSHPDVASRLEEVATVRPRLSIPRIRVPRLHGHLFEDFEDFDEVLREELGTPQLDPFQEGPRLGVTVEAPSDTLRAHLRLPTGGVVVRSVVAGSLAERFGMRPHDILVELAGKPIHNHRNVRAAIEAAPDGQITAKVIRAGTSTTLTSR